MKRTLKKGLLILPVVLTCTCLQAVAQEGSGRTVSGAGGADCASPTLHLVGTLGQSIVGAATTRNRLIGQGFWHGTPAKAIGSPVAPVPGEGAATLRCNPNPIAKSGTIEFNLVREGHVTLTLHDLLGRTVHTFADERRDAGSFSAELNANEFAAGRYAIRMSAGPESVTIPVVIAH